MAKSNRLIKTTLLGGGRQAQVVSLGAMLKGHPTDKVPEGYVLAEGFEKLFVVTQFTFKAKLRDIPTEIEGLVDKRTGEPGTCETEMLDWVIDWAIAQGFAIYFEGDHKPTRMDFQFRLECRGFIRDKKTKEQTYGLVKL